MTTIAVLQMVPTPADPVSNLARIAEAAEATARSGGRLLVTPELSITGYALGDDHARLAESADGPLVSALKGIAERFGIAIVAGFPERADDAVYNSAALVEPSGAVTIYRKCHLYGSDERAAFRPSDEPPGVVVVDGLRIGLLICYDVEYPEMVRHLALEGADLVVVPTALPRGEGSAFVSGTILPARAYENHVFIAYAGLCGTERGLAYQGGSVIVAPDGAVLARADAEPALLLARLDPTAHAAAQAENPYLADRRPELYGALSAHSSAVSR